MNRTVKAALAIVCAGALLAGAGAGVAFGEYSSLRYEELPISGSDQAITASETVEVGEEGDVFVSTVYGGGCSSEIVADESVTPNTLVINAQCSGLADGIVVSKPRVSVYEEEVYREDSPAKLSRLEERVTTDISVHPEVYYQDGFSEFMRNKDVILEGLKKGVVYDIPSAYDDFHVEVRVNPVDLDRVYM